MRKYSSGKHSKPNQNKYSFLIIAILLFFCIVGVVIYATKNSEKEEMNIEEIINNAFSELKSANVEKVNKYIDYNQLVSSLDEMILQESQEEVLNLQKELFESMNWTIKSINVEENKIEATIEMENKDFKEILTKWIKEIVDKKETNEVITNEFSLQVLEEIITKINNTKKVTKNIQIEKQNDSWIIIVNDDLRNLIFTGIESVITGIEEQN